jgi:hypothetical protein
VLRRRGEEGTRAELQTRDRSADRASYGNMNCRSGPKPAGDDVVERSTTPPAAHRTMSNRELLASGLGSDTVNSLSFCSLRLGRAHGLEIGTLRIFCPVQAVLEGC